MTCPRTLAWPILNPRPPHPKRPDPLSPLGLPGCPSTISNGVYLCSRHQVQPLKVGLHLLDTCPYLGHRADRPSGCSPSPPSSVAVRLPSFCCPQDDFAAFDKVKDSLSIQIFKINANVKGIEKLVDKLNGQPGSATARNPRDAL